MIDRSLALVLLVLMFPGMAAAQGQPNPYSNLFGREVPRSGKEFTEIHFRSTAGAQQGWSLENEALPEDVIIPEGMSAGADASMSARYIRDKAQIISQARYSYQEYRQEPAFGAPAFDGGVRATVRPRTRISLQGGANYSRSPYYQMMWLAPELSSPLPRADQSAMLMLQNETMEASGGVTSYYTSRSSLEFSGVVKESDFAITPQRDFSSVSGLARWSRQMTRDLGIHAGYGREQVRERRLDGERLYINDRIDIGVDYGKSLTLARRTSLGFGTETAMLKENNGTQRFRLNGFIGLQHRFLKTWQLQASARRASDFMPGFQGAVFSDQGHLALAGYLASRLLLNINADGGRGEAGLTDIRKFASYTGSSKLTFAMTRHFGLFTQYAYYNYQVPADPLTLFLVPRSARQAVSFGVETWVPIFDKEKVTRDPR